MVHIKFDQDRPTSFRNILLWNCGRTTDDDGRRMPAYPISSPVSLRLRWAKKLEDSSRRAEKTLFIALRCQRSAWMTMARLISAINTCNAHIHCREYRRAPEWQATVASKYDHSVNPQRHSQTICLVRLTMVSCLFSQFGSWFYPWPHFLRHRPYGPT